MKLKLTILSFILLITAAIAWLDYSHSTPPTAANTHPISTPVPEVEFTTLDGSTHRLDEFKGKTVLVNFWASWCAPCVYEFPVLVHLAEKYHDDLALILFSSDEQEAQMRDFILDFRKKHSMPDVSGNTLFPEHPNLYIVWDEKKRITKDLFQTIRYPETLLISPNGTAQKIIGSLTDENLAVINKRLSDIE